jgi:putative copper export protein
LAQHAERCDRVEWIVARWLTFVATLIAGGSCTVALALLPRSADSIVSRTDSARSAARVGIVACLVMIPASLLRLADQVMALRSPGDPLVASLDALLGSTTWGAGFVWHSASLLVTLIALVIAARSSRSAPWFLLAALGAAGLCASLSWQGHAIGSEALTALAVAADMTHVVGASLWLGSLMVIGWLGFAVPDAAGLVGAGTATRVDERLRSLVPLVPRVALPGAAMVLTSGVLTSLLRLRDVTDLWRSSWGQFVLAKTVLASIVVMLGALNWQRRGRQMGTVGGVTALRRTLFVELCLALMILLITSVLVVTPLPGE